MMTLNKLNNKLHEYRKCSYCQKDFNNGSFPRKRYCSPECNHDAYVFRKKGQRPIRRNQINDIAEKVFNSKSLTEYTLCKSFNLNDLCKTNKSRIIPYFSGLFFLFSLAFNLFLITPAYSEQIQTASWYSFESCRREGTSGFFTASGEPFNENAMTCALPNRNFGGLYKVTNLKNGKFVIVRHSDFGPGKKPRSRGVVVDLSKGAFQSIADLKQGIVPVKVEAI